MRIGLEHEASCLGRAERALQHIRRMWKALLTYITVKYELHCVAADVLGQGRCSSARECWIGCVV